MKYQQQGYILFLTFSILALCTALVSMFLVKGFTHKKFTKIVLEQQQMQQFLVSTTALAQSLLAFSQEELQAAEKDASADEKDKGQSGQKSVDLSKKLLEKVLPVVNKTQSFTMKEIEKDFPVVINLTFFCESGKININGLYDLVNKNFYNEGLGAKDRKVFATWLFDKIAKITEKPSLLQPFIEHVKQRKLPFNDVTELLAIKEFSACFSDAIFYESQQQQTDVHKKTKKLFLTDIFTVASESDTIQPWLLSPSVCVLLDIPQQASKQVNSEKKDEVKVDLSSFKPQADWKKDWDVVLKPLYSIGYDRIPEQFQGMLSNQFSASTFSILVQVAREIQHDSSFDSIEQDAYQENDKAVRMFAILKQNKLPDNSIMYDVIKIYKV